MPRVSTKAVHQSLDFAAQNVKDAAGYNGITSRKEMAAKVASIADKTEAIMTDVFYRYTHHQAARVTSGAVEAALAKYKQTGVDARDVNKNGLSKGEIKSMSWLGQLAVEMAKKNAPTKGAALSTPALQAAFEAPATKASFMSESDYNPKFVSVPFAAGTSVAPANLWAALQPTIAKFFTDDGNDPTTVLTFEAQTAGESAQFVKGLGETEYDDDYLVESAQGFAAINKLFKDSLTDLRVLRVGPQDDDGTLATDQGLYVYAVVGKTNDGNLAGMLIGSVET